MIQSKTYSQSPPSREEIDALQEPVVIEFGTPWCGYCRRAQPLIEAALAEHPEIRHIKIEDGRGRRLGRTFGVKLWPTLVFLSRGRELARVVRPVDASEIREALGHLAGAE